MAKNYTITFKGLRAGDTYVLSIGGGTGTSVALKGGESPFSTQEDDNDDFFQPVRTQTGYLRIVDDGKDANGNAFSWNDLLPATDTSRPVTLTRNSTVVWQGYMQTQNFSGVLYGGQQEREFPVQCQLSVLGGKFVETENTQLRNFAWMIQHIIQKSGLTINTVYIQGGSDAQAWLLNKMDWRNFINRREDEDDSPKYSYLQVLEDMCRFWGWTARVWRQNLYFACADDSSEQSWLSLNSTQLTTMAGGTAAGTTNVSFSTVSPTGDIFVSMNNDTVVVRGCAKAVVKADVNAEDLLLKFAPKSVRDTMDAGGYTWVDGQDEGTGYFTTPDIYSFTSKVINGQAPNVLYGGFCRRQIYSKEEQDAASKFDMIDVKHVFQYGTAWVKLQSVNEINFGGGSLSLSGTLYNGANLFDSGYDILYIHIGIGATENTAKWWYMARVASSQYNYGWSNSKTVVQIEVRQGAITGFRYTSLDVWPRNNYAGDSIPVDANLSGKVFIEILGAHRVDGDYDWPSFQIGDFTVKFSRDEAFLNGSQPRVRTMDSERVDSQEYTAANSNAGIDEWNTDCIFASDNNMKYGLGLLINTQGTYMGKVSYDGVNEYAEQHLANRVSAYWNTPKRELSVELRSDISPIGNISPLYKVTLDGTTCYPVAINHDWRNDITILTLMEL